MKRMKLGFSLTVALCLVGGGQTLESLAADGAKTNLTVEVLIFSGRPNPTWQLQDTNSLHALKARFQDLPVAFETEPAEWSKLGFGGFRIRGGETIGLPSEIRIYQGVVKTGLGTEAKYLRDLHGLEQSLIAEIKSQPLQPVVKDAITNYENTRKGDK